MSIKDKYYKRQLQEFVHLHGGEGASFGFVDDLTDKALIGVSNLIDKAKRGYRNVKDAFQHADAQRFAEKRAKAAVNPPHTFQSFRRGLGALIAGKGNYPVAPSAKKTAPAVSSAPAPKVSKPASRQSASQMTKAAVDRAHTISHLSKEHVRDFLSRRKAGETGAKSPKGLLPDIQLARDWHKAQGNHEKASFLDSEIDKGNYEHQLKNHPFYKEAATAIKAGASEHSYLIPPKPRNRKK